MLPWPVWFFIIAGFLFCVYRIVSKARIIHQGSKFDAVRSIPWKTFRVD
jgi:hypothetical protein